MWKPLWSGPVITASKQSNQPSPAGFKVLPGFHFDRWKGQNLWGNRINICFYKFCSFPQFCAIWQPILKQVGNLFYKLN